MDLPPDLQLNHEVKVPTMLWAIPLPAARPMDPSTPRPKPVTETDPNLPEPPVLERPNHEQNVATQKIALSPPQEVRHLSRIPATTSPVVKIGSQMAIEIPQIASPSERDQPIPGLISFANQSLQSVVVALPPANQVAETRPQTKMQSDSGSASSVMAKSTASSTAVGGSNGRSTDPPSPTADAALPVASAELPGTKRLTRPKDGRFAAVVVGSASAGPYSEQTSPLQGKVIYTVHVDVGFRRKWILQYSVMSGEEFGNSGSLEGPWPVVLVVPVALNALDLDYLMVHGIISAEGKFDRLALTYPTDYEEKENLVKALSQWEFRPARRGQGNAAVEVLLIIPRQPA